MSNRWERPKSDKRTVKDPSKLALASHIQSQGKVSLALRGRVGWVRSHFCGDKIHTAVDDTTSIVNILNRGYE